MDTPGYDSPTPVAARVKVIEYDPQSPGANPAVAAAVAADEPLEAAGLATLRTWIEQTMATLTAVKADAAIPQGQKYQALRTQLGSKLPWLGKGGADAAADDDLLNYWLFHLLTTRALEWSYPHGGGLARLEDIAKFTPHTFHDAQRYVPGQRSAAAAAMLSGRFLMRVAAIARAMGEQKVKSDVALERLCEIVLRRPTPVGMSAVIHPLSPRSAHQLQCAKLFCVCARELGLLNFDRPILFAEQRLLLSAPANP